MRRDVEFCDPLISDLRELWQQPAARPAARGVKKPASDDRLVREIEALLAKPAPPTSKTAPAPAVHQRTAAERAAEAERAEAIRSFGRSIMLPPEPERRPPRAFEAFLIRDHVNDVFRVYERRLIATGRRYVVRP